MIQIIPSISIIGGKVVRLAQGNYKNRIEYEESPIDIAQKFEDHGIKNVHVIDLDGTKKGSVVNYDALGLICGHTNLEVNFGGGVNTDGDMMKVFEYGAKSVTVGSLAIKDPSLFSSWIISYGRRKITLSADALNGKIRIRGWQTKTETDLMDHISNYYDKSILYVKCSDVAKDGLLEGPSFGIYKEILEKFSGIKLLASGGISSLDDIKKLEDMGVYAAIIGKAYYENKITLKEISQYLSN
ncbi:MAG: 1-(5-phosphoribosyl)-5-((5-phosphoribosylamino)methylideneamino)imidazole-4-carboxamide isomerase [Thalassobius sp.]|nr:1-(5-phosphoribosyl)-5-((5-phosphoribosylamino)methylideneamino)imidazole-4-carboxamide isomerase [Thalassovita sp.]